MTSSVPVPALTLARARVRFVRSVIEGLDTTGLARMRARLSDRLNTLLSRAMKEADPDATMLLDDAESLFIEGDAASGKVLGSAFEQAGRATALQRRPGADAALVPVLLVRAIDDLATVFTRAILGAPVFFDPIYRTDGATVALGVGARPRSARVLGHWARGFVQAAGDVVRAPIDTRLEMTWDRAIIEVRFAHAIDRVPALARARRPSSLRLHAVRGPLSAEVDRILGAESLPPSTRGR